MFGIVGKNLENSTYHNVEEGGYQHVTAGRKPRSRGSIVGGDRSNHGTHVLVPTPTATICRNQRKLK